MHTKKPTVSIIIPTLDEATAIPRLLQAVSSQTYKPLEIIVVDGKSEDATAVIAKQHKVNVLLTGRGIAHQRNLGGQTAKGGYLFFLDADVSLKSNFIAECMQVIRKRQLDIACPHYWPYHSSIVIKALHTSYNLTFWLMQKLIPSGGGSCIIVRREIFRASPGFDPRQPFEDMKFLREVRKYGKFGFISPVIGVSDRRFKKDGTLRTAILYWVLTPLFILNLYGLTKYITYKLGHYDKK